MKLIQLEDYLLLIDEEAEIKKGDYLLEKESIINIFPDYLTDIDECDKIIAYYPLTKEAKELDLPWLPKPFKEDNPFLNGTITKATCYTDNGTFYIEELKKLFETQSDKQFSLEDMIVFGKKCFYKGFDKSENDDANCFTAWKEEANELLQPLSTQQLPKEFVGWLSKKKCPYDFTSRCTIDRCDCEFVFETITNSEGKEEIQGTYKY